MLNPIDYFDYIGLKKIGNWFYIKIVTNVIIRLLHVNGGETVILKLLRELKDRLLKKSKYIDTGPKYTSSKEDFIKSLKKKHRSQYVD